MKTTVKNLKNEEVGEIELDEAVFGVPLRTDLLARMVNYQLAKRRGMKRAIVATARRLSVILHRMWTGGSDFRFSRQSEGASA